jgi:sugar phosphate isomerase/epimerase
MVSALLAAIALSFACQTLAAEGAKPTPALAPHVKGFANPFYAMDNGVQDRAHRTPESQVKMLKELGYAGIGWRAPDIPQKLKALDEHGLKMFSVYAGVGIDSDPAKVPDDIRNIIGELKGRDAMLWLFVTSRKHRPSSDSGDAAAVELIGRIGDLAARAGLRVALYPHAGFWVERVEDAVRVAKKVGRANVGVTFNLCHWLKVDDEKTMLARLDLAVPHLFLVSINGADPGRKDWKGLIQPLDRGTFDTYKLLVALRDRGYSGPIALQSYGIGGDARDNLARAMETWRGFSRRMADEWVDLLADDALGSWRQPLGDWKIVGDLFKDPGNERRLASKPGIGVAVNGVRGRTRHLVTKMEHGGIEAHIEFVVPKGSNSGAYFMGRYEIQVLDSWGVEKPKHGDCGGIYQRWRRQKPNGYEGRPPRVNASLPPGEWQSFDVIFRAPRFDDAGRKVAGARFVKVVHNGIVVHENEELSGPTRAAMFGDEKPTGPLMFQGDHGPVAYRNVSVRPLK